MDVLVNGRCNYSVLVTAHGDVWCGKEVAMICSIQEPDSFFGGYDALCVEHAKDTVRFWLSRPDRKH
jgi:hypothetical protein